MEDVTVELNKRNPIMGSAILGGVGQLLNTGANFLMQRYQNRENLKMAKYAYSKDLEMWNKNNAYNTPSEQMRRLNEAGLNPNLVYGTGSVHGNTSGSLPNYNAPTMEYNHTPVDFQGLITMYQDLRLKQAQIDNVKAQTRGVDTDNFVKLQDATTKQSIDWWSKKNENDIVSSTMDANLKSLQEQMTRALQGSRVQSELSKNSAEVKYQETRGFESDLNREALKSMTPTQRLWFTNIMKLFGVIKN